MTNDPIDARAEKMDAAVMDVRIDKDQMKAELKPQKMLEREPEKAEIKSRPYIKVILAGIFFLSLCANVGSLASSLASKETCVTGEGLLQEGQEVPLKTTERRRLDADNLLRGCARECVITNAGVKECTDAGEMIWELVDPDLEVIPNNFLKGSKDLTGTLKLGAAVKTIGKNAFLMTEVTGLDLSDAASLKWIDAKAFLRTRITGTIKTPFNVPRYKGSSFPKGVSIITIPPGLKECADAPSGTEPCWELADPGMTDIPDYFLQYNTDLTGTLKLGAAVKAIGDRAFYWTKLTGLDLSDAASLVSIGVYAFINTDITGLDLSDAASLVSIGEGAFWGTDITGTLVFPANVETIGVYAFYGTKLTGLDLSNAASLVSIGNYAFELTDITGTLVIPADVETIGESAFYDTDITGLDLSNAASLVSIGIGAFESTDITGTIATPFTVPTYNAANTFPAGVYIVEG